MKLAYYIKNARLENDPDVARLLGELRSGGHTVSRVTSFEDLPEGTGMLLSIGGDGTFLSASRLACKGGIPLLGVNYGRLGFLSDAPAHKVAEALSSHSYRIEPRTLLRVDGFAEFEGICALNEVSIVREDVSMMDIDVSVSGSDLPPYRADGIIVSTSSGSTAYNLSAGGPICSPDADVLLVTPIAPHNLNVRPLVVGGGNVIRLTFRSRSGKARLTVDGESVSIAEGTAIEVSSLPSALKVVRLDGSSFIGALTGKLFWGEDKRNNDR